MTRKSLPANISRKLWAQCGGYCQRPDCNQPLFAESEGVSVSLVNVAHIIGHGVDGPRSEHELAKEIDKDGFDNLIMLCLACHKIVDELESQYPVEQMQQWKTQHASKISTLFTTPSYNTEAHLLRTINDLLEENRIIFQEYGPYSDLVIHSDSGDALTTWRKRSLETIIPNNQKIITLIESHKNRFGYPWDTYRQMLKYKMHADAFQDNCLSDRKVSDYKTFPIEFDHFIKTKLGIPTLPIERVKDEELEFRHNQIKTFINRFLSDHSSITKLEELNKSTMIVDLQDGRSLKVFVTNTYYFTEYTLDKVIEIDPAIDAIICSCPSGQYAPSAKTLCIEKGIGLFMLNEFMGAIRLTGEKYLNYLLNAEKTDRVERVRREVQALRPPAGTAVYLFGSYLRQKAYNDIDIMIVYSAQSAKSAMISLEANLRKSTTLSKDILDITIASSEEFATLKLQQDNMTRSYPG
ncbi:MULTISPECIES: nucleotidyltransferase domain-containing protein [unclassified Pseudomonas]|uniref:nucleotidyltransferase domain-containing protein n=1 Tax=unclassified Pseudomonas TaxID=196821 RepID=UPI000D72BBAF|nr:MULTISPECIES: nucleotidyltransferase domain-containing protein [unclassified Pseudomonas]HDS1697278.1 nucleotidyltransferase domain-containing protein [Pseudomonas putida]MBP2270486.1 putative nucleotidyltransferase [Pseudomonas sp. BP6]MBP2285231.1 putative nucleotidyltransferase [Pseudomonas sp. BP7]PWY44440.1 nucleotidyltransferase [Pseudomonas sp. RW405]HDS1702436.1 nucleotidyltransferase domain-containing protein [Pseudomonas putida]